MELRTERLLLRGWRDADRAAFAMLNADPQVMQHFPAPLSRAESDAFLDQRVLPHLAEHGYGLWAVERRSDGAFLGTVGLMWQTFPARFTPALEVGWRLARPAWGHGYATEAAHASLRHAFDGVGVDEVVSMTSVSNAPSRAVMERLGMTRDPERRLRPPPRPRGQPAAPARAVPHLPPAVVRAGGTGVSRAPRPPAGWPPSVPAPGTPGWERRAVAYLLDVAPGEYRAEPVYTRYPAVLAWRVEALVEAQLRGRSRLLRPRAGRAAATWSRRRWSVRRSRRSNARVPTAGAPARGRPARPRPAR